MGGSGSKVKGGKTPPKQKPPPKKEITAHERAVLDLKNQRDKLHRYRKQVCLYKHLLLISISKSSMVK